MSKIIPLGDQVMLSPTGKKDRTDKGVIILGSIVDERDVLEWVVVETGPRVRDVAVGDRVLAPRFCGNAVAKGDCQYRMAREKEILGIVEVVNG